MRAVARSRLFAHRAWAALLVEVAAQEAHQLSYQEVAVVEADRQQIRPCLEAEEVVVGLHWQSQACQVVGAAGAVQHRRNQALAVEVVLPMQSQACLEAEAVAAERLR